MKLETAVICALATTGATLLAVAFVRWRAQQDRDTWDEQATRAALALEQEMHAELAQEDEDEPDPGAHDPSLCHCATCAHRRIKERKSA